jgi:DNA polymerase-3 subunit beta
VETEVTMSVKLVEARFPPYDKVIPGAAQRQVSVSRVAFLEALRRTSLISREKMVAVRLTLGEGKLTVASDNPDVGEAREEIDAQHEGEELTVGFNGRYLIDVLAALDCEEVEVDLSGPSDACVIKPAPSAQPGFLGVIMPMRL